MPARLLDAIAGLAQRQGDFDRVSVGFPGVVRHGVTKSAPNLAPQWEDFNLAKAMAVRFEKPVQVANDADVQGFGAIAGTGVELVLTLGTGVGSALFVDGRLVPNVEVGWSKLGNAALKQVGKTRWNRRLVKAVRKLESRFNYDRLYIGGGNAKHVRIDALPPHVTIVSNVNGLVGGIALWRDVAV
jgi:polyphosphate glucokinase